MTEPLVNVIITTYNRLDLLVPTLKALVENLQYSNLGWIIADDGSPAGYVEEAVLQAGLQVPYRTTNAERRGVGYSKNIALRLAFEQSPFVLLLEDDWVLKEPMALGKHIAVLEARQDVGMIRLGYLGGHLEAVYDDWNGPFTAYWGLKPGSGFYIYSGQVSLRHQRFYEAVGFHAEGCAPGVEEESMCHRYSDLFNATQQAPLILWPAEYGVSLNAGPFINIGLGNSTNGVQPL